MLSGKSSEKACPQCGEAMRIVVDLGAKGETYVCDYCSIYVELLDNLDA